MDTLAAARAQMEVSLAFHMIFAALGIGMPLLMLIAERLWLRTHQPHYRELARKWAKATALAFAVGAVSGTALSFELGLLWPRFMALAGGVIGPAFALEGYAFFIEAIFLGLYLYGWDRLTPRAHWWTGVPVALSGLASGILVVAANSWMQAPPPFEFTGTTLLSASPLAPFRNPAWAHMALHSSISCYVATAFAVAGVYAVGMLRGRRDAYHRSGLGIAMTVACVSAIAQSLSGDVSARSIASYQPAKLAAMEAVYETDTHVPLLIGGIPDDESRTVRWKVEIPSGLSLLVGHSPKTEITGLDAFPADERPNTAIVHIAFQTMVGCGVALALIATIFALAHWRKRDLGNRLLQLLALASPLGFLALEAGWIVTEAGRQPWVIHGVMRTADGVTPAAGVPMTFFGFTILYVALGTVLAIFLRRLATTPPHACSTRTIGEAAPVA